MKLKLPSVPITEGSVNVPRMFVYVCVPKDNDTGGAGTSSSKLTFTSLSIDSKYILSTSNWSAFEISSDCDWNIICV